MISLLLEVDLHRGLLWVAMGYHGTTEFVGKVLRFEEMGLSVGE